MGFLIDLVTGAASGGLLGLIGSLGGAVIQYFNRRQEAEIKRDERAHEMAMHELQVQARAAETENEVRLAETAGSWQGLTASHQSAAALTGRVHTWVNDIRALFRPFITLCLLVVSYLIFRDLTDQTGFLRGDILSSEQANDLIRYTVQTLVFSASTAVTWWFGDRAMRPASEKNH